MQDKQEYTGFLVINFITCIWHVLALVAIYYYQAKGWFMVVVSIGILFGMNRYIEWLFKPSSWRMFAIFISAQILPPAFVFIIFLVKVN